MTGTRLARRITSTSALRNLPQRSCREQRINVAARITNPKFAFLPDHTQFCHPGLLRAGATAMEAKEMSTQEHLKGCNELEVVDIYQSPLLAKDAQSLAAPTLIKQLPLPIRRLIGDLSERGRVLMLLDLKAKARSHG